eukprot:TRINITY_DN113519_c0_g1_i1.p1 TRINITY_DN113519_c0_g1~~TRINITY_DN113519_c0_g1_i1.p1  ORF type:complete len:332 (-),score=59.94 TRINITY_DN113519_c0_g1_i1:203-1198(-)
MEKVGRGPLFAANVRESASPNAGTRLSPRGSATGGGYYRTTNSYGGYSPRGEQLRSPRSSPTFRSQDMLTHHHEPLKESAAPEFSSAFWKKKARSPERTSPERTGVGPVGKRVVGCNRNTSDGVQQRMQMREDADHQPISERKHTFVLEQAEAPSTASAAARQSFDQRSPRATSPRGSSALVQGNVQHRTSPEMAAAMRSDTGIGRKDSQDARYFVGDSLVRGTHALRRAAPSSVEAQSSTIPDRKAAGMAAGLQTGYAARGGPERASGIVPTHAAEPQMVTFGQHSTVPLSASKSSAYACSSGFSINRHGMRSPGAFSPNMRRVPVSSFH